MTLKSVGGINTLYHNFFISGHSDYGKILIFWHVKVNKYISIFRLISHRLHFIISIETLKDYYADTPTTNESFYKTTPNCCKRWKDWLWPQQCTYSGGTVLDSS